MKKKMAGESTASKRSAKEIGLHLAVKSKAKKMLKGVADRKLRADATEALALGHEVAERTMRAQEWLLPTEAGILEAEDEMERTYRVSQRDVVQNVDIASGRKVMDIKMEELGPYSVSMNASGRFSLLIGRKGHLALMEWKKGKVACEVQVKETSRNGCFLHNENYFAVAQKKYCYIYDKRGLEVHCLKEHTNIRRLEFLRRHFLLASIGDAGVLRYQDTSTGQQIASMRTKLGACSVLCQNTYNAVLCLGHHNGAVTMWSPTCPQSTPLVQILCHRGPVCGVAVDRSGKYMATTGTDSQVKIWDIRKLQDNPIHEYFSRAPASAIGISERDMLAVSYGSAVQIWKDVFSGSKQNSPYMTHRLPGKVENVQFCPYEDVLFCGHSGGVSSMLVPGAGEPNFDSTVANPYETKYQRREAEVNQLLDKLMPEMIMMDPDAIGTVGKPSMEEKQLLKYEEESARREALKSQRQKNASKSKMKGKNKPTRRRRKQQDNVYDDKKAAIEEKRERLKKLQEKELHHEEENVDNSGLPKALERFIKKKSRGG